MVDVSNGITWLRGLLVRLVVIPEVIYIMGGELNCLEGHSTPLPASVLAVQGGYYLGRIADFRVLKKPSHGSLRFAKQPDITITKFTMPQLEGGHIQVPYRLYLT